MSVALGLMLEDEQLELLADLLVDRLKRRFAARFVSKHALAEHYGVAERTIKTWREKGLPGHKVGREVMFSIEETDRWIDREGIS